MKVPPPDVQRTVRKVALGPPARLRERRGLYPQAGLEVRPGLEGPQVPHRALESLHVRVRLGTQEGGPHCAGRSRRRWIAGSARPRSGRPGSRRPRMHVISAPRRAPREARRSPRGHLRGQRPPARAPRAERPPRAQPPLPGRRAYAASALPHRCALYVGSAAPRGDPGGAPARLALEVLEFCTRSAHDAGCAPSPLELRPVRVQGVVDGPARRLEDLEGGAELLLPQRGPVVLRLKEASRAGRRRPQPVTTNGQPRRPAAAEFARMRACALSVCRARPATKGSPPEAFNSGMRRTWAPF